MLKYNWKLSDSQPMQEIPLFLLQQELASRSVLLDLTFQDGGVTLTLVVDDTVPVHQECPCFAGSSVLSSSTGNNSETAGAPIPHHDAQRGRPYAAPNEDLTLAQVRHMKFMNIPMQTIADTIGVSRRTLFRRLQSINGKHLDENTPFSKWLEAE